MLKNIHIFEKATGNKIDEYELEGELKDFLDEQLFEITWNKAIQKGLVDANSRNNYVITIVAENTPKILEQDNLQCAELQS